MKQKGIGKVICDYCHREFEKKETEIVRNSKRGRPNYCSRRCSGKANFRNLGENLWCQGANKPDELSPFRRYLRDTKGRNKEVDIDVEYLKDLWESQKGVCIYTGISLQHSSRKASADKMRTASVDRIDPGKGYIKGNVQFISIAANYMKFQMSHDQTIGFCKVIANHWNKQN